MLESKIEQLTAAIIAMTERLDRFNQHFEYVLYMQNEQGKPVAVMQDDKHTPQPVEEPTPEPEAATANADYNALRASVRALCIKAVQQKKMNKAGILAMFAKHKEGCDVVDNLPNEALPLIAQELQGAGVTA
jgi:hypothetical protein